jgi:insertion element IS1 protein InsB
LAEKKAAQLPPLSETLIAPDPYDELATVLELDELWSFVLKRVNQVWIWIAPRQVVARAIGDRSEKTCRELWNNIPDDYRKGNCFTDFWKAYQRGIPKKQLTQVGKETGETAHIERWNWLSVHEGESHQRTHVPAPSKMRIRRLYRLRYPYACLITALVRLFFPSTKPLETSTGKN